MTKTQSAAGNATDTAQATFLKGADVFKANFDKAVEGYDTVLGHGKSAVEAYVKSASAAGRAVESLHNELYAYSKAAAADSIAAGKAILSSKSVHEVFELQAGYAKSAFDAYVAELGKVSDLVAAAAKDAFAPLQERASAWAETVQSSRAV